MKFNIRIVFASLAALVAVSVVSGDCIAAVNAKQDILRRQIVQFAQSKLGKKVDLGQGGECTELIHAAFKQYGAQPMTHRRMMVPENGKPAWMQSYSWGAPVISGSGKRLIPPAYSIVQFEKCKFEKDGYSWDFPHHTAIVERVSGTKVTLLHQNVDGSLSASVVRRHTVDFAGKTSGSYAVFYPIPQ